MSVQHVLVVAICTFLICTVFQNVLNSISFHVYRSQEETSSGSSIATGVISQSPAVVNAIPTQEESVSTPSKNPIIDYNVISSAAPTSMRSPEKQHGELVDSSFPSLNEIE